MRPWWKKPQELFTIQTDDVGNRVPAPRVRERTPFFFLSFLNSACLGVKSCICAIFQLGKKKKSNCMFYHCNCAFLCTVDTFPRLPSFNCALLWLVSCTLWIRCPAFNFKWRHILFHGLFIWALSIKERGTDAWYAVILWTTPLSVKAEGISSQQEVDSSSPCNDA